MTDCYKTAVSSFLKCSLNFMSVMYRQQQQDESSSENCAADRADYAYMATLCFRADSGSWFKWVNISG